MMGITETLLQDMGLVALASLFVSTIFFGLFKLLGVLLESRTEEKHQKEENITPEKEREE